MTSLRGHGFSVSERLAMRSVPAGECIIWTGRINNSGYGQMNVAKKNRYVHRVAYEVAKGPIPDRYQIDHLCRNKLCINPEHLEAITQRENIRRSNASWAIVARTGRCLKGHEMSPENVYERRDRTGRICRACKRIRDARYRQEARDESASL